MKTKITQYLIFLTLITVSGSALAQTSGVKMVPSGKNAEKIVTAANLRSQVDWLADSLTTGRETGAKGNTETCFWISKRFEMNGLMKMGGNWTHNFQAGDKIGHNVIGFLPGNRKSENQMYTIVSAHFDTHGVLDGKLFPGADSNASGVVAMLTLSDMYKKMKDLGRSYGLNIIFVGLDARECNSAGAAALWEKIANGELKDPLSQETIEPRKIHTFISLDILGSTLEPVVKGRKDYLIMLSDNHFKYDLIAANKELGMDIHFDYYGSKNFTEVFYKKIGDQAIFLENGVMSVLFTSGITMDTNKTTDTADKLNYEVFRDRIILIFNWLSKLL